MLTYDDLLKRGFQPIKTTPGEIPAAGTEAETSRDGALGYGVDVAQKLGGRGIQAVGSTLSLPAVEQFGRDVVAQQDKDIEAGGYQPTYKGGVLDQPGVLPKLGWVGEKVVENAATMAPSLLGFGAAALTAPVSGPLALASTLGASGANFLMNTGETAQELDDKGVTNDKAAIVGGALKTGLDVIGGKLVAKPLETVGKQIAGKATGETGDTVMGAVRRGFLGEGSTEGGQDLIDKATAGSQGAVYTPGEVATGFLENFLVGGAMGGPASGIEAGVAKLVKPGEKQAPPPAAPPPAGGPAAPADGSINMTPQDLKEARARIDAAQAAANVQADPELLPAVTPPGVSTDSGAPQIELTPADIADARTRIAQARAAQNNSDAPELLPAGTMLSPPPTRADINAMQAEVPALNARLLQPGEMPAPSTEQQKPVSPARQAWLDAWKADNATGAPSPAGGGGAGGGGVPSTPVVGPLTAAIAGAEAATGAPAPQLAAAFQQAAAQQEQAQKKGAAAPAAAEAPAPAAAPAPTAAAAPAPAPQAPTLAPAAAPVTKKKPAKTPKPAAVTPPPSGAAPTDETAPQGAPTAPVLQPTQEQPAAAPQAAAAPAPAEPVETGPAAVPAPTLAPAPSLPKQEARDEQVQGRKAQAEVAKGETAAAAPTVESVIQAGAKRGIHVFPIDVYIAAWKKSGHGFDSGQIAEALEKRKANGATLIIRDGTNFTSAKSHDEAERIVSALLAKRDKNNAGANSRQARRAGYVIANLAGVEGTPAEVVARVFNVAKNGNLRGFKKGEEVGAYGIYLTGDEGRILGAAGFKTAKQIEDAIEQERARKTAPAEAVTPAESPAPEPEPPAQKTAAAPAPAEPVKGEAIPDVQLASWAKRGIHAMPIDKLIKAFRQEQAFSKKVEELEQYKADGATLVLRHGIKYIPARSLEEAKQIARDILAKRDNNTAGANIRQTEPSAPAPAPAPAPETAETQAAPPDRKSTNTIITDEMAEAARARLKAKLGRLNAGLDPEMIADGAVLAAYHIERGFRSFAAYSAQMIGDMGEAVRPYLRAFYEGARHFPGFDAEGMTSYADLERLKEDEAAQAEPAQPETVETVDQSGDKEAIPEGSTDDSATPRPADSINQDVDGDSHATDPARGAQQPRAGDGFDDDRGVRDGLGQADGRNDAPGNVGDRGRNERVPSRKAASVGGSRKRVSGADYRPAVGGLTREGSWFETAKRNLDIIDLARKIEAESRPATPEEQTLLSKYVGFGAGEIRNNLFPVPTTWQKQQAKPGSLIFPEATNDARWKALAERAAALPEEWQRTILQSTQYAHYTSENVIRSIWSAVQRLGFTGGKIFEPGAGIGSFAMLMPEPVHETSTYTGIEFDGPTALVAKLLSPQQRVLHADFIKRSLPDDFFDVAVGNPPFAAVKVTSDPRYQKNGFLLHDYFFAKTIDKVRPGGLLAFVTSKGTMDKKTDKARRYLMARADFLGAIRLPSTAFEENAGTSVVTDAIFLRKRADGEAPAGLPWGNVETVETPDGPIVINEYFASHPEMVLGQNRISGNIDDEGRRINSNGIGGEKYTVVSYDKSPEELDAKFAAAVEKLPSNVYSTMGQPAEEIRQETAKIDFDPKSKKEGSVYVSNDGTLMRVKNGVGTPLGDDVRLSEKDQAWFKGYVGLRDLIQQVRYAQLTDGEWEKGLKALNKAYDAFFKEHGPINAYRTQVRKSTDAEGNEVERSTRVFTNRRLLREDYEAAAVMQIEVIDEDGNIQKSKFLRERTIGKPVTRNIQTIGDALAVSLDNIGKLNVADIAQRMKMPLDEAIEALGDRIYRTPAGEWQLSDEYLSGNVVEKLRAAEEAAAVDPSFERNVKALQEVQPEKLGPSQISVKAGAGWVPVKYMNEFAAEIGAGRVTFDTKTETWSVEGAGERSGRSAADEFGTSERSPSDLLQAVLNSRSIKITKTIKDGDSTKTVADVDATTAANDVAKKIKEKFKSWVWTDTDRAADLVEAYNDRYNTLAPRVFDGSHLSLPGLSLRFKLHPHQLRAIWRQIQTGNTYLAHAVGAGKTIEMIAGGMEQKRLGLIKKPMYVVPNHMLEQFANEFMELYPLANIMVADDKNFSADKRKAFVAAASMNAPDAIVITHSAFELIGVKEESIAPIRDEILDDLEAELADAAKSKGDRVRRSQLQRQVEAVTQRFDSILAAGKKDNIVSFEDMGVDFVYVDEAHTHRKLDFNTEQKIKGIDPNGSRRALDMYVKTRWLESQRPGRSMVFASGTPVTNTMGELYTIMRFFAQKALDEGGISTFDSWSRMFGETVAALEPNAAGKYEVVERFARFDNVPELMSRIRMFMDVLQSDQLGAVVTRPEVRGGKPEMVIVEPTKALLNYQENVLNTRLQESRKWKPTKDEPNNPDPVIAIISDGRFAAVDPRFFGGKILPGETTKIDAAADKIIAEYAATSDNVYVDRDAKPMANKGGTQIVFYNTGFGASAQENRGFNARAALTKRLVDGGIQKKQIAWFDDADTDAKKEEVFKGMRNGTYRVLIGSAKKMGTGVNVQNRLTALHYIDPPWFPADVEQPRGRIIRQGNQNKIVGEFWYATKGGYDSTMWQMVGRKQRFIDQAFSGDKNMRSMEDLGEASLYEQAAALASGDPRAIQLAGLKQDIERLERQHSAHATEQLKAREALRNETAYLHNAETAIEKLAAALEALGSRHFRFDGGKVGETTHETQTDFGQAIKTAFNEYITTDAGMRGRKKLLGSLSDSVKIYAGGSSAFGAKDGALDLYVQVGNYKVDSVVWDNTDGLDENVDALGLTRKIINAVNGIDGSKERAEKARNEAATNIIRLKKKIGAPFEHGQEMLEKHAALKALEEELRQEGLASNAPEGGPTEEEMSQALDAGAEIDAPLYSRQPAAGSQPSPALHAAVVSGDAGRVLSELRNDLERAGDEFGVLVVDRLSTLDRGPLSFSYSGGEKRLNSYSPLYHLIRLYDGYSAHALLHELVHAFTAHAYKSANAKERARIDAVYEAARAAGADDYHYGLTSVDEFMAEVFSNRDFRDFLKSVPYQKTTLWGGFVQAVRRLLGFPAEQTSALDEAIDAIDSEIFARNTNGAVASRFHATPLRMAENATPAPEKAPPPYKSPTDTIAGVDTGKYGFDYADVLGDKSPDSRLRRLSEILYENREGTEIEGILSDPADKAASVGEIYDELAWLRDTAVDLGNLPQWGDANFSPEDFPGNVNSARAARLLMTDADVARLARNGGTAGSGTLYSRLSSTPASRGTNGQGLPLGQVQRLATTFARKLGVDPARVVVLRSADEIGAPAEYTTKGAYDSNTDTVYLFADALDDADDARRVLLHEIVGHKGVRAAVGDGWTGVRQRLEQGRAQDRGIADLFARVQAEEDAGLDTDGVAEEVIARAAEQYGAAGPLHWRRILGAIRAALRRLGLVSNGYTLNEVVDLLAAGRQALRADGTAGGTMAYARQTKAQGRIRRTVHELIDAAKGQENWRNWYDKHEQVLSDLFGNDAELFKRILSATSQANTVKGNVTLALKAYEQFIDGQPFTGFLPAVANNLDRIRADEELRGDKISQYGKANEGDASAIAVDRHISMLMFNEKKPNAAQIKAAKARIIALADRLGWQPREVQAALWAFNQTRLGTDPGQVQSYDRLLENRAEFIRELRARYGRGEGGSVQAGRATGAGAEEGTAAGDHAPGAAVEGSPEWAAAMYAADEVPDGWYVHGRRGRQDLKTGQVIQLTKDWEAADNYSKDGSKWIVRPAADAKVMDFSDPDGADMRRVINEGWRQYKKGILPRDLVDAVDGPRDESTRAQLAEAFKESFAPDDIVNSASAYDAGYDWINWLYDTFGANFVHTPDGAVAFDPEALEAVKVPSAEEMAGVRYSRTRDAAAAIGNYARDAVSSPRTFNLFNRTVGTQFHKAWKSPEYGRVYRSVQDFLSDAQTMAYRASAKASTLLPRLDGIRDVVQHLYPRDPQGRRVTRKDVEAAATALFDGRIEDRRWSNDELAARGLTSAQIGLYQEARAAVDASLDDVAAAVMARLAALDGVPQNLIDQAQAEPARAFEILSPHVKATTLERMQEEQQRIQQLKDNGYAPLSRFGDYFVRVTKKAGKDAPEQVLLRTHFETRREANAAARALRADPEFRGADVAIGVLPKKDGQGFTGLTPETLELFGDALGLSAGEHKQAYQEYLKTAVVSGSALKRLIRARKIAGYSTDLERVLASFIISNSRHASRAYHTLEMNRAWADIPEHMGDVRDEARDLIDYVQNPREEAAGMRGLLFAQFLGGSIASAITNMTQPIMMTYPYLSSIKGVGPVKAAALMGRALAAVTVGGDADLMAAMKRAEADGTVAPQEIHQLYAEAIRSGVTGNRRIGRGLRAAATVWGSLFSISEQINRRLTFAAAYMAARDTKRADPFAFAENAVTETQGQYNKGNRPNWGRGAVGATLMTFKQYSIAYMEFLSRLPSRERAMALGLLALAAGAQGLPGADDLDDLVDTLAQALGYNWRTEDRKRAFVQKVFAAGLRQFMSEGEAIRKAKSAADFAMYGLSATGIPIDVQQRMGLGNLIPGTELFKRSSPDKTRDVMELAGPAGSVVQQWMRAWEAFASTGLTEGAMLRGGWEALKQLAPTASASWLKAYDMAETGYALDARGRRIAPVTTADVAARAIGYQPASIAALYRDSEGAREAIALAKVEEGHIVDLWADGRFQRDEDLVQRARARLDAWNARNPDAPIRVQASQIMRRVREMVKTRDQRLSATAPKEMRAALKDQGR